MECNKDEAVRAKAIADMKLEKQDYLGAKKFVLKAQSLYPQLDGLSQLSTTIDVYISAANKVGGEVDWFGVLGISHTADDDAVRKQYRKLVLMLHPDKNKSPGADGAFKLIYEAWSLLSDRSKRLAYNQRRWPAGFSQNASMPTSSSPVPPQARPSSAPKANQNNAWVPNSSSSAPARPSSAPKANQNDARVPNSSSSAPPQARPSSAPKANQNDARVPNSSSSAPPQARPSSAPKANQNNTQVPRASVILIHLSVSQPSASVPSVSYYRSDTYWTQPSGSVPSASYHRSDTYWTQPSASVPSASNHRSDTYWAICKKCSKHYELLKMYLNHTFSCTNCGKAFVASAAPPPSNYSRPYGHPILAGICIGFCTFLLSTVLRKKF